MTIRHNKESLLIYTEPTDSKPVIIALLFVMYVLMSVVIQPFWLPNPIKLIIIIIIIIIIILARKLRVNYA